MKLTDSWNTLWAQLTKSSSIGTLLAVIGIAIILFFVIKWFWDKRRGQGGGGFPIWPVALGLLLAGPKVVFPVVLTLIDAILGFILKLVKWASARVSSGA